MSSFLHPRAFVPISIDTTTDRAASSGSPQRTTRLRLARTALGGLTQLIREPTSTLFKFFDGSALNTSSVPTDDLDDPETIKSLLRLRLLGVRKYAVILVDFQR